VHSLPGSPRVIPVCTAADELPPVPRAQSGLLGPRGQIVLGSCACAAASLFVYAVDPTKTTVYPQCLLYNLTGIYCAGCGATRALYALLHGRVLIALHDNALFVAALPVLLYVLGTQVLRAWRDNAWPRLDVQPRGIAWNVAAIITLMIAFMILRNLPGEPFAWLRPVS
jgi:hypothetical protein